MKTSENEQIKSQIKELPDKPGIYKYYTKAEELIYIGKAKSIKKRVSSYFNKQTGQDKKTQKLVSQIHRIEFTIVNTEFDAYLLENNLIKEHQPKYNILLRDDKTYPYLYISKERFPRLIATRKLEKNLGTFYGPYTSVKAMNTVMDLVKKLFTLRTCNYNLSKENIDNGKYKICLEYHIGNCRGPCENLIQEDEYIKNIDHVHHILKGNLGIVKGYFRDQMVKMALELEYEKAQLIKEKIEILEKFQAGSIIVNPKLTDLEVLTLASVENIAVVNYLYITNGLIVRTKTLGVKKKLQEQDSEIILSAIAAIRNEWDISTNEILTNIAIEHPIEGLNIQNPKIGDKKKLIDLSYKNSLFELKRIKTRDTEKQNNKDRPIQTLQKDLQLTAPPIRIECFDNSNIQGTNPVAAVVCFINGKPAKKEYRHYNVKTVEGPDDYASMREIVYRRYKRQLEEGQPLPDLIVIDGGKGQLSAAIESLRLVDLYGKIPIIGIAKRLEEIYYPEDQYPLYLDKKSSSLKLLQYIRDEAHRFALTFHRNKRSQSSSNSSLSKIPGIGEKTYQKLIRTFKSVKRIKETSEEEIARIIGPAKAKQLKESLLK
jgi:excinuclease ABC subunit C